MNPIRSYVVVHFVARKFNFWPWERISHGPTSLKIVGVLKDFSQSDVWCHSLKKSQKSQKNLKSHKKSQKIPKSHKILKNSQNSKIVTKVSKSYKCI